MPRMFEYLVVSPLSNMIRKGKAILADSTAEVKAYSMRVLLDHILEVGLNVLSLFTSLENCEHMEVVLDDAVTPVHASMKQAFELI
jgi:hypothetical protein